MGGGGGTKDKQERERRLKRMIERAAGNNIFLHTLTWMWGLEVVGLTDHCK